MRIFSVKILFYLFFVAILSRLFYWQVIQAEKLQVYADNQHFQNVKLSASRGQILFSDNSILASTQPTYTLYGLPKVLSEGQKKQISAVLSQAFAQNKNEVDSIKKDIYQKLSEDLYWVNLFKGVNLRTKKDIEQLNLPGIGFEEGSSRFYPEGSSSAHLLGFVGADSKGDNKGYFGLEGYYDGELKGLSGDERFERDAFGLPILIGKYLSHDPRNGKTLVLNIDRVVQYIVEKHLKEDLEKYGARSAQVVVLDPKTGAIIGMAAYPNYDPGKFNEFPSEVYKNPLVADAYEPGSTFKVLIMAAALNENLVKPDTECDICSGPISLGGFSIRTWDNHYFPNSSMTDVIIHSDNTGMVFISEKLGVDKLYSYLESFGFGKPTGVDLQEETSPGLRPKKEWREIDLATSSFGQGIAVTAMQMISAVATIANNGNLMEPHMVKQVKDGNLTFDIKPKVVKQVISENTAKVVTEMMIKAVDKGEAKWVKSKGFKIAGKTGTAQIPVAGHYDANKTIASFVGFAPPDNPKFVMLVRFDQPTASIFGAETAAPTFFSIAKELFNYYKIVPEE